MLYLYKEKFHGVKISENFFGSAEFTSSFMEVIKNFLKGGNKMDETKEKLNEEIKAHFKNLSELQKGSKERTTAVNELNTLYRLKIDENKKELEDQLNEQKKERIFKAWIVAAEIILPLAFYAFWIDKGLRFEKDGAINSTTFRGFISRLKPTKGKIV